MVLDIMLPGQNGFEVLRQLRNSSEMPVIMLTARGEDVDRIVGLEMGADDYLPKPFNPRELTAPDPLHSAALPEYPHRGRGGGALRGGCKALCGKSLGSSRG